MSLNEGSSLQMPGLIIEDHQAGSIVAVPKDAGFQSRSDEVVDSLKRLVRQATNANCVADRVAQEMCESVGFGPMLTALSSISRQLMEDTALS